MELSAITPVILAFNEKENIGRVLERLTWAREIVVIDSFSDDTTLQLVAAFPNAKVYQRRFDNHENQWNFGLDKAPSEWILSLDSDYIVTDELRDELAALTPDENTVAYQIAFRYCVFGDPLTGTVLPPRTALFKKGNARYVTDGHTQLLEVNGKVGMLRAKLHHDDRKPLSRWLGSQDKYMPLEVAKLFSGRPLSFSDRIRKAVFFAPLMMFFYCLIIKGGIFDGQRGWYYAYQRMLAESLLSIRIIEHLLQKKP